MKNLVFCLKAKKKSNHLEAFSPNIQSINRTNTHTHERSLQGWSWSGLMLKSSVGSAHGFFNFKRVKYFLQPDIERFFFFPLRPPPRVTPSPPPPYRPGDIFICRHRVCVCCQHLLRAADDCSQQGGTAALWGAQPAGRVQKRGHVSRHVAETRNIFAVKHEA